MTRRVSVFAIFALWIVIQGAKAIRFLESVPTSNGGMLTAGVGQQISLTCSHDNNASVTTLWKASVPIDCERSFLHSASSGTIDKCGPFSFVNVSEVNSAPFTSTAVANANTSMTGAVVQCFDSLAANAAQVGSDITLCVYGPLASPANLSCQNTSQGLEVTWDLVVDESCAMSAVEYNVTIPDVFAESVSVNRSEIINILEGGVSYNISVVAVRTVNRSFIGEPAFITCVTAEDIPTSPPPTTSTVTSPDTTASTQPTMSTASTPSPQQLNFVIVVVPIIVVIIVIVIVVIVIIIIVILCRPGQKKDDHGLPLSANAGGDDLPVYAMVDKSKKGGSDTTDMATYQDPSTIQHEQAETGDLYAVADKPKKSSKKEKSEEVLADMYSVPDKSKKSQLTYAEIETSGGSGRLVNQGPQTDYATVVN